MYARHQDLTTSLGLLLLRLGLGGFMLSHGWGKLQMLLAGDFDNFGDPLGMGKPVSLVLAVGAEVGCSLLVMLGLLTRLAAIPVVITMAVAALIVHANDPLTMTGPGSSKEPALLFLIPFLALVCTGAGKFSLDALIWPRTPPTGHP